MSRKKFIKTPDQVRALKLFAGPARYVLLFGGSRSGKTFITLYAVLIRALREPGSRHAILRLRGNAVRQSVLNDTLPKVCSLCFPKLQFRYCRNEGMIQLPNHSELWFCGLDREGRAEKILGREFATLYFNECSELDYSPVTLALTRLAQRTNLRNCAYFDCNPPGKSHWTYKLFVEKLDPLSNQPISFPENYAAMQLNPAGNAENLPPGYLTQTLAGLSRRQRERFLEGKFLDDVEGALFHQSQIDRLRLEYMPEDRKKLL